MNGPRAASPASDPLPLWQPVLLTALAGGMGWGIRGQYGHETGAMIAGLLVSLVLVFLYCPKAALLPAARAVAFGTIAMGLGGSMTYGQTIGLTQNAAVTGNWEAWRWGMLGLALKGAVWIGFAGLALGVGLSRVRYARRDVMVIVAAVFALHGVGWWLLNTPFDPANRVLPRIYFSASWYWQPDAGTGLTPRPEVWGGLLFALIGAWTWVSWVRGDRLARNLTLWAALGGLGFPLGQCLQSFHAWNPEVFAVGLWATLDPAMNWWNWMETTFGLVMGACLALGLWFSRRHLSPMSDAAACPIKPGVEWALAAVHVTLLILSEFSDIEWAKELYDSGLVIAVIPIVAVAGGRWWPFLLALPITLLPIAGKTIRNLVYGPDPIDPALGWAIYGLLPILIATAAALWFAQRAESRVSGRAFARRSLLLTAWLYFGLNLAIFRFPWPWDPWTSRTPNALFFTMCLLGLTLACATIGRGARSQELELTQ